MDKSAIIITGSSGEIGKNLINYFTLKRKSKIICIDLNNLDETQDNLKFIRGDILDANLLDSLCNKYNIKEIYHLAAILSSKAELHPALAYKVNVIGTMNMLEIALHQYFKYNTRIKFFFPSSIAVHGYTKPTNDKISENMFCNPKTVYGQHKLFCENLGIAYDNYGNYLNSKIDFRSIRFPGIISANSVPSGGTSDYIPEMIHKGLKGSDYECFVNEDSLLPFIVMPDAINAIINLMNMNKKKLSRNVYSITAFSPSIKEVYNKINNLNASFKLTYKINQMRQSIINTWPRFIDDTQSKKDWDWQPKYNLDDAFSKYLIPSLRI